MGLSGNWGAGVIGATKALALLVFASHGGAPAVSSSYFLGSTTEPPNATTRNKEDLAGNGTLDTLTIIDGLGRVLQTQVEADVAQGAGGPRYDLAAMWYGTIPFAGEMS